MRSLTRAVVIPKVLDVGEGALDELGPTLQGAGFPLDHVVVVRGRGPSSPLAERALVSMAGTGARSTVCFAVAGTRSEAARLGGDVRRLSPSLVVGVGGGRVIDTAKVVALDAGLDVVSVPTTIASDGICSPVASLADDDGHKESVAARMPAGIVLDLGVVASAPTATRRAGLGDLLSNLVASLDWQLAGARGRDVYDSYSALIAESAARPALGIADLDTRGAVEIVAKGLILSGLAMATAGTSRPCSGAEHLISHSLDRLLGASARLHGQQVALGAIIASEAHGSGLTGELRTVFARCGLPTHPDHLGLPVDVVAEAVRGAPSTRPDRYTVLSDLDLSPAGIKALLRRAFPSSSSCVELAVPAAGPFSRRD